MIAVRRLARAGVPTLARPYWLSTHSLRPAARQLTPIAAAFPARRWYSPQSLDEPARAVAYDQVKNELGKDKVRIVDVREPDEYAAGHIPGSVNIPFRSSPGALGLEPAEFEDTFGFKKPDPNDTLLFYCQGGVRSSGAEQLAATYGYRNRLNYKGSMDDWLKHQGKVEVPPKPQEPVQQET